MQAELKTFAVSLATMSALCYGSLSNPYCNINADIFDANEKTQISQVYDPNPYYDIILGNNLLHQQIEIINNFVSALLENSQDLDPEFSDAVDRNFLELV